jgi:hypothetical protein
MVKRKKADVIENDTYILPSPNEEMRLFISKFKVDMMEHIVSSINFAVKNKLPIVEVFQFRNSPFVVTIAEKEFATNLDHIGKYYKDNQIYELYPRVEQLCKILKDTKTDEKEKPDSSRPDKPDTK